MTDQEPAAAPIPAWIQRSLNISQQDCIGLDGGLASELEDRGYRFKTSLWSAQLLLDNPSAIYRSHLNYLEAGAQIITSSSYQATVQGLSTQGIDSDKAQNILIDSVNIAIRARDHAARKTGRPALVAASIGPYGAYLADGSEYCGNYGLEADTLAAFHQRRIELLDASEADILACETIPDYHEACALAQLLKNVSTPCWTSFCCQDGNALQDGTSIEQAVALFEDIETVFAVGVNCTPPEYIAPLIQKIHALVPEKIVIAYPNSGERYRRGAWSGKRALERWQEDCRQWIDCGAKIIGGCCRIGPKEIGQLAKMLAQTH